MKLLNLWGWMGENVEALSAIATAVMAILTFCALIQNRNHMREMKRQRDEDIRAYLTFSIECTNRIYYLVVRNLGKKPAYNVIFKVEHSIIQDGCCKFIKDFYENLSNSMMTIAPNTCVRYRIAPYDVGNYSSFEWSYSNYQDNKIVKDWRKFLFGEDVKIVGSYRNGIDDKDIPILVCVPFSLDV